MKASLVLRYILEGRLNYNNFNQALMQSTGIDLYYRRLMLAYVRKIAVRGMGIKLFVTSYKSLKRKLKKHVS